MGQDHVVLRPAAPRSSGNYDGSTPGRRVASHRNRDNVLVLPVGEEYAGTEEDSARSLEKCQVPAIV